jgi:leader peptidase (prepilin peptidase)/N-methyltransferase
MNAELLGYLLSPASLALFGLCIGSFLNVVIHRLPLMLERQWKRDSADMLGVEYPTKDEPALGLATPASRCPACGHQIKWYENIPVASWLVLRGRCSSCSIRISARYPFVELLTGALFGAIGWKLGPLPSTVLWCLFAATLVALAGIDWDTTLLPDDMTLPLLWAGLTAAGLGWIQTPLLSSLWGTVAGYVSLWSVYWLFKLTTGKEGMGYGDFKLLAALGAWMGWQMILPIVLASSVIGAVVGIAMKFSGALREGRYVPFGPFLAGAGLAVMLIGSQTTLEWLGWA